MQPRCFLSSWSPAQQIGSIFNSKIDDFTAKLKRKCNQDFYFFLISEGRNNLLWRLNLEVYICIEIPYLVARF